MAQVLDERAGRTWPTARPSRHGAPGPQLEGGPLQIEADLDVAFDVGGAEVEDQDAGTNAGVELGRAGPVAQALDYGMVDVQALGLVWVAAWAVVVLFIGMGPCC